MSKESSSKIFLCQAVFVLSFWLCCIFCWQWCCFFVFTFFFLGAVTDCYRPGIISLASFALSVVFDGYVCVFVSRAQTLVIYTRMDVGWGRMIVLVEEGAVEILFFLAQKVDGKCAPNSVWIFRGRLFIRWLYNLINTPTDDRLSSPPPLTTGIDVIAR